MTKLNEDIISEINCIQEDDIKGFLMWLMEFERENSDKARISYKTEIDGQVEKIVSK